MTNNKNDKNLILLDSIKELEYITNTDNLINVDNDKRAKKEQKKSKYL